FAATTVNGQSFCRNVTPFKAQTQVKAFGSYPLPGAIVVSAVFQNSSGPTINATYPTTNALIAPSLGRNLAAGPNASVNVPLVAPNTLFADRSTQLDLRLTKRIRVRQRMRLDANFDV